MRRNEQSLVGPGREGIFMMTLGWRQEKDRLVLGVHCQREHLWTRQRKREGRQTLEGESEALSGPEVSNEAEEGVLWSCWQGWREGRLCWELGGPRPDGTDLQGQIPGP